MMGFKGYEGVSGQVKLVAVFMYMLNDLEVADVLGTWLFFFFTYGVDGDLW